MTNPTLWGSLITGLMTGVIALSGVIYTQRRADRRERDQWNREREHEQILWEREEAARTFEQRREGYSAFYERLRSMAKTIYDAGLGLGPELDDEWQYPLYQELLRLELYATPKVHKLADKAYNELWHWGDLVDTEAAAASASTTDPNSDDFGSAAFYQAQETFDEAQELLLAAMRDDLRVPKD
ncbi:hypothetical protein [Amycolatopsis sp. NPDC049868]|uniref:hypothetical protein n=1 Tax=Amycolatopsis sp. NPDC049868 TaxID=3363934 RepID=UPI00379C5E53